MTGSIRRLALAAIALALVPSTALTQDLVDQFERGVSLMERGRDADALAAFRAILAEDPDQAAAYELWKATDGDVWIDILVKEGEFELFARHMMELAKLGRAERRNDPDTIRGLVGTVVNQDGAEARAALHTLAADHGEYAVPQLVPFLADAGDDDRRIRAMQALTRMDTDVVLPLVEALQSDDAYLRRNVAFTLGRIGDPRALPALAAAAADADGSVQAAAQQSLADMGGAGGSAVDLYLKQGDDYHNRRDSVLRSFQYSDVVWQWDGSKLVPFELRRELYNDELAKRAYARALALDPASLGARAGFVRAWVSQIAKLDELDALGEDVADLADWAGSGAVAVRLAGVDAADGALRACVRQGDPRTAVALCRLLGQTADAATAGLGEALASEEAATRTEAAIALGRIAVATGGGVPANAVAVLGDAAGREVVRIAAVIDANAARAQGVVQGLRDAGWLAYGWNKGAKGLAMVQRVPGVDAVLVGDDVADLTPQQVLAELGRNTRTAGVPKVVLSAAEDAGDVYGAADAVFAGAQDLAQLDDLVGDRLSLDRERANRAAMHAAAALAHMARGGVDVSGAVDGLTRSLAGRPDEVAVPAMQALAVAGGSGSVAALVAVAADDARSDEARAGAARALASVFRRGAGASDADAQALMGVVGSDAALAVRAAAALALGSLQLDDAQRAEALFGLAGGGASE